MTAVSYYLATLFQRSRRRRNSLDVLLQWQDVGHGANRGDAERVNLRVASRIVPLDVLKLRRLAKRLVAPVQVPHPQVQPGVPAPDVPDIALEVLHVDRVEADERDVQADVGLGDLVAKVERPRRVLREVRFCAVQGGEEGLDVLLVGLGRGCEAGLVHAVVDEIVGPLVGIVNLLSQILRVEVDLFVLVFYEVIKLNTVQHFPFT